MPFWERSFQEFLESLSDDDEYEAMATTMKKKKKGVKKVWKAKGKEDAKGMRQMDIRQFLI